MHKALFALALLPWSFVLASDPPVNFQFKPVDNMELSVEALAYSFFFHGSIALRVLNQRISQDGLDRLAAALAVHKAEINDPARWAAKRLQLCTDLRSAKSGEEFAAVFVRGHEREDAESRQVGKGMLSVLDADDRNVVETFLDTRYRQGVGGGTLDYHAAFTSEPFPSGKTKDITRRACERVPQ
jgi:hypothetical protein